ncbi:UNVERIFIED_ORG: hypothetical protein ABIC58_000191 [Leuconostoc holzapfelii]
MKPVPFLPYAGLIADLTARLARPIVLALIDFLIDGVLIPNFIYSYLTL